MRLGGGEYKLTKLGGGDRIDPSKQMKMEISQYWKHLRLLSVIGDFVIAKKHYKNFVFCNQFHWMKFESILCDSIQKSSFSLKGVFACLVLIAKCFVLNNLLELPLTRLFPRSKK